MGKKGPIPPIVSSRHGIARLAEVITEGQQLRQERPVPGGAYERWENHAKDHLIACFGSADPRLRRFFNLRAWEPELFSIPPEQGKSREQALDDLMPHIEDCKKELERRVKEEQEMDDKTSAVAGDPRKVFVIHGRNIPARNAMFHFLRSIKLDPVDFDELSGRMGGSEFIGNIIRQGMEECRGIIALFTPDEQATLDPHLAGANDAEEEKQRRQARPNVIFEAGMAMGIDARRTILVTLGADVKLFSDAAGRHIVRLNNTNSQRDALLKRLRGMGCLVNTDSGGWYDPALAGDFETCVKPPQQAVKSPADQAAEFYLVTPAKRGFAAAERAKEPVMATGLDMLGAETLEVERPSSSRNPTKKK